jgi:hypothetical protein
LTNICADDFIRLRALNDKDLKPFPDETRREYCDIMVFSGVRWLGNGKILQYSVSLAEDTGAFLNVNGRTVSHFIDPSGLCDLTFLIDICGRLNDPGGMSNYKYVVQSVG